MGADKAGNAGDSYYHDLIALIPSPFSGVSPCQPCARNGFAARDFTVRPRKNTAFDRGVDFLSSIALSALTASLALLIAALVGSQAQAIGAALRLLDYPDVAGGRKDHARVTPLVGGIVLALASAGAAVLVRATLGDPGPVLHLGWLAVTIITMFLIGVTDDRFHLAPVLRLGGALVMLALVVADAPDFSLAFLRFAGQDQLWLLGGWGVGFTLLCLVGLLNAVNMADGKNGVVIGMGLIWTVVLAFHLPPMLWPVLAAAGGALAMLFAFNMAGRLFLGDGGSYALSALFGLLAIYAYNHDFAVMRADDVAVLFAIPVIDTIRLMAARAARRQSPFHGDSDHLHHHLFVWIGWPRGLGVYLAMVALPNAAALLWPGTGLIWLLVSLIAYVGVLFVARAPESLARPAE
jgi:UDP-GlcNAc:undecaprenyl-phosphate GlcNAc-1-phosphate transferase